MAAVWTHHPPGSGDTLGQRLPKLWGEIRAFCYCQGLAAGQWPAPSQVSWKGGKALLVAPRCRALFAELFSVVAVP